MPYFTIFFIFIFLFNFYKVCYNTRFVSKLAENKRLNASMIDVIFLNDIISRKKKRINHISISRGHSGGVI